MKKSRRWLVLPLLALLAYFGFRWFSGAASSAGDEPPEMLYGRVWLEKMPDEPTDYVQGAYVLVAPEVGLFQRASAFDFHIEIFRYDSDNNNLKVTFPQSGKSSKLSYSIKGCDDAPPFDLCLTLSDNPWKGAPKKYYGFRDSEEESKRLPGARDALRGRAAQARLP